jgi:arylsulfatase
MLKQQVDYEFFDSVGPLRGLKGQLYEGGIRVPLVARWPGKIQPGTVSDLPAVQYDMMATLADLTGATAAADTDGVSILPTLKGNPAAQEQHEYLFWDFAGYGGQLAVRMGKWKGIKKGLRKNPDAPLELYDLEADIGEQEDLVEQHPDIAAMIEKIMLKERSAPAEERFRFGRYPDQA